VRTRSTATSAGLDDLFTENPRVVNGMIDIYETWIRDFGIDGFRIDTMKHVNDEFWQTFGPDVLAYARAHGKKQFFMFGEVFDTTKSFTSHFPTHDRVQAVLDFPFQQAAQNFAANSHPTDELRDFFAGDDWYTDADSNAYQLPTFLGNHDMGRIGRFVGQGNPGAGDAELLARDRLAHELMYLSRGNPVVYYGDEQGFTGDGGDQDARQDMFPSQVASYNDDDLIGTDATTAVSNFDQSHPLYRAIGDLARLTQRHPALRDGAQINRWSSSAAGIYAFSRVDRRQRREYLVAVNNSETAQSASVPTYMSRTWFERIYGGGERWLKTGSDKRLRVTVAAAVGGRLRGDGPAGAQPPRAVGRPEGARHAARPRRGGRGRGRRRLRRGDVPRADRPRRLAADRHRRQRARTACSTTSPTSRRARASSTRPSSSTTPATRARATRAVARSRRRRSRWRCRPTAGRVRGEVEVRAVATPEHANYVVTLYRSVAGGAWTAIGTDDSSPVYTAFDDTAGLPDGETVRYKAVLTYAPGRTVESEPRSVTGGPEPGRDRNRPLQAPGRRLRRLGPAPVGRSDRRGVADRVDGAAPALG
jgi:hypothetical protein